MVWQSLVAACALLSRSVLVDWRALVQHLVPRAPMYPFSYSGRALHISIRYEPNNTGWVISCPASTSNSNSTARLADLFSVASIQTPSGVFHIWRHNDIFPIAGLGTYISGVGIHLQLRGLIPSIGTHRRLANLDSFVNHHTPGIFGLDGVQHEYLPAPHALITSRRGLELISPGFTLRLRYRSSVLQA